MVGAVLVSLLMVLSCTPASFLMSCCGRSDQGEPSVNMKPLKKLGGKKKTQALHSAMILNLKEKRRLPLVK